MCVGNTYMCWQHIHVLEKSNRAVGPSNGLNVARLSTKKSFSSVYVIPGCLFHSAVNYVSIRRHFVRLTPPQQLPVRGPRCGLSIPNDTTGSGPRTGSCCGGVKRTQ